ncbi:hypothetical protein [Xanthomonas phage vB_XooS_NR08]|nr:hypothetical protein [Xanthomonas phage vB_XooS_NR08]
MQMSQLKPASQLARRYGVKSVVFGSPGSGKTPLINTAPRPVLLVTEPGMLSMRGSNVPAWEAYSPALITEFFEWFMKSREAANFDTLGIDSISNIAEIILAEELSKVKHGMKAYGNMSERTMKICNDLYYMPQKHIVMIAKQGVVENGRQTILQGGEVVYEPIMQKRPFFPGKDLNVKVPHLFDNVLHLGEAIVPGQPKSVRALRTKEIPEVFARDRLGNLGELEPPDLSALFTKAMQ